MMGTQSRGRILTRTFGQEDRTRPMKCIQNTHPLYFSDVIFFNCQDNFGPFSRGQHHWPDVYHCLWYISTRRSTGASFLITTPQPTRSHGSLVVKFLRWSWKMRNVFFLETRTPLHVFQRLILLLGICSYYRFSSSKNFSKSKMNLPVNQISMCAFMCIS